MHTVGGRRIIDRVADALAPVTTEIIVITGAPDADQWLPGARVIPDAWRRQGSLVGIHTGLTYAQRPILLVAWDMPFVTRALFELLIERSTDPHCATVPESAPGTREPFCAVYTPACLPVIESQLAADDLRLSRMLELQPSLDIVSAGDVARIGNPRRLFFNVNSAEDLAAAEQIAAGD